MSRVRADHYRANRVSPEPFSTTGRLAQFCRGFRVSPDDVSGIYARAGQCFGPMFLKTPFSAKAVLVKESVLMAYTRMSDVRGLADRLFGQEEGSRTD